jgi:spermidine/putrescine transport system ATP-binding protein
VAVARSLAVEPRLLLLDEPLGMLDHNARRGLLDLLRSVHDQLGTATVHVTHDREEAWALGGRCAVMNRGRLEAEGSVEELFRRPAGRFVAEFLGGENLFAARFERRGERTFAVLDWAEFELAGPVAAAAGWVRLRPETLHLAESGSPGAFPARVLSVSDRGAYRELRAGIEGGPVLTCHLPGGGAPPPGAGGEVFLRPGEPPHPVEERAEGGDA